MIQFTLRPLKQISKSIVPATVADRKLARRPALNSAPCNGNKEDLQNSGTLEPDFYLVLNDDRRGACGAIGYYSPLERDVGNPFAHIPQLKLEATSVSRQREVFALLSGCACLMNNSGAMQVSTVFNDRVLDVYRESGVSIPSIDAAILEQGAAGFGSWDYTNREYRHLLNLAQLCEVEMALYFANMTTQKKLDWVIA